MTDAEYENNKPFMFERTDDPIVADAVSPKLAESTLKPLPDLTRIIELSNPFE